MAAATDATLRRWPALAFFAGAIAAAGVQGATIPDARIEIAKSERMLRVWSGAELRSAYRIGLGGNPVPPKRRQGDMATPEGRYVVSHKNPRSRFHLSLGIGYPNADDAERGQREGLITKAQRDAIVRAVAAHRPPPSNTALGGDIFVHGRGSGSDWTWGCIALDDADMQQLYDAIEVGTPVVIRP